MKQFNFKFNPRNIADSLRSCREKLSQVKREDVIGFFRSLPRRIAELKPRDVYDFIITALTVIHVRLAAAFLWVFRMIGKGLARVPWALRYAAALFVAVLLLLLLYTQGSSLFLLNSYSDMEPYADRNANKIGFHSGDIGTFMTFQLFNLTEDQKEKAEKLDAIFQKNRSGEGAVPTEEQIQLVHELSGVSMDYLEGAMNISVQIAPVKLAVHLKLEKADGTAANFDKELENPTPKQLELARELALGDRFMAGQIPDLLDLLTVEEKDENGRPKKVEKRSSYDTKYTDKSGSFDAKEVSKFTCELQKSFVRVVIYLQPIEVETTEDIELKFDADNTVYTRTFAQYGAFRASEPWTIIPAELAKINEKLRQVAARETEQMRREVQDKVNSAVESYKASRGLRKLDLKTELDIRDAIWGDAAKTDKAVIDRAMPEARKKYAAEHPEIKHLNERDEVLIRDGVWASHISRTPLTIEKKTLKGSQIGDWYTARFNAHKFNQENLRFEPGLLEIIFDNGLLKPLNTYLGAPALILLVVLLAVIGVAVASHFVKVIRPAAYYAILAGGILFTLYWFCLILVMFDLPDDLLITVTKKEIFSSDRRNEMWFDYIWFWMPTMFCTFFLWFPLLLSSAKQYFGLRVRSREPGEVIRKNLMCEGANGGLYRSFYWVVFYHIFFLLILPLLLVNCYDDDEYKIPKGDGGGQVQPQKVVQKKKKNKKKKIVLNPNSAFIFAMPDMPDEELLEEIDEKTADQYVTSTGTFGPGKKGGKPGWPNGMENGVVRFIRLKYNGGDWDQDMGKGADYNMLLKIKEYAGFNIASDTEYVTVDELQNRFRKKGKKPPFVYITGMGGINMTTKEIKQLRDYLLKDGGMLFADNGGGHFDSSIRNLLRRVLPNHSLVDIANDDMIYQQPFYFPNGAPRLWHHSGDRAMGIKNNGRWIVFYHQGDINDAWKTGGSGASPQQQSEAFKMGANVIAYAFSAYLNEVYGDAINH